MSENINITIENEAEMIEEAAAMEGSSKYNLDWVLTQIETIQNDTSYLNEAITNLSHIDDRCDNPGAPVNLSGQAKAQAIEEMIRAREATNQKLLGIYEKMYADLADTSADDKLEILAELTGDALSLSGSTEDIAKILENLRHMFK